MLIPMIYLKGVSTGAFDEVLSAQLGKDAGGLAASTVGRLKDARSKERARWSERAAKRYVSFWADGHRRASQRCHARGQEGSGRPDRRCAGESAQSWKELLFEAART